VEKGHLLKMTLCTGVNKLKLLHDILSFSLQYHKCSAFVVCGIVCGSFAKQKEPIEPIARYDIRFADIIPELCQNMVEIARKTSCSLEERDVF